MSAPENIRRLSNGGSLSEVLVAIGIVVTIIVTAAIAVVGDVKDSLHKRAEMTEASRALNGQPGGPRL